MSTSVTSTQVQGDIQLLRPARALVGWMNPQDAAQWLAGPGRPVETQHNDAVADAQAIVASRPDGFDQSNAIFDTPPELSAHVDALQHNTGSALYFAEGFQVKLVNLSKIIGTQRQILTDDANQRVAEIDPKDITSIASVTLPLHEPKPLTCNFDTEKKTWVFSSANPNLRVVGQFNGQVQPGVHAFGFAVAVSPSFLQVARYQGRYLLRDGYHRAFGCLARGITHVPAFVRDFQTLAELNPPAGLSPEASYMSSRPPLLGDYLDDTVSALSGLPVAQKVVMIQALEVATLG